MASSCLDADLASPPPSRLRYLAVYQVGEMAVGRGRKDVGHLPILVLDGWAELGCWAERVAATSSPWARV
ncbi:hypothetical protein AAHA92_02953 [Salvia divinorum]|uniref:Uncharacterized protein n=1 Tax=Salvia divinorum TaxID=28513 RepID=A0ABD1IFJ3_SALDI